MIERLELLKSRYNEINEELLKPEVLSDFSIQKKLSKEKSSIEEVVLKYDEYLNLEKEITDLKTLVNDPEMHDIAIAEIDEKKERLNQLLSEIEILLLPKDANDGKDIIMEIRGAAGGDEANIFAGDLFRMYSKYAEKYNWKIEINREEEGTSGGFSQIEFSIKGDNVYSKLKYESGVHRVQRVPETETQGRIHTSTATVLVMPEVEDIDVEEDTITETYLVTINVYGKKLIQQDISNGMLKAIYYVVELFTMSKDSLVLIDEFENGLGVNCIDWLSELILDVRKDLQFIITSHHPKIINEIEKEKWKIIDRTVCTVKNYSSDDYGIGNSQHDAYFNLVNRWEYEGKI